MIRRPPRSTLSSSSAASDVYKRQVYARTPRGALTGSVGTLAPLASRRGAPRRGDRRRHRHRRLQLALGDANPGRAADPGRERAARVVEQPDADHLARRRRLVVVPQGERAAGARPTSDGGGEQDATEHGRPVGQVEVYERLGGRRVYEIGCGPCKRPIRAPGPSRPDWRNRGTILARDWMEQLTR